MIGARHAWLYHGVITLRVIELRPNFPIRIKVADSNSQPLETNRPAGYIELLRGNRSFRQVWLGQVVSQMGDWFDTIALYTIILNLTGSGRAVGLLLVARFVPSFLVGSLSGVVADRFSRRSIMIVSDLLRAVVVLGFLFVRRVDQLWIILSHCGATGAFHFLRTSQDSDHSLTCF